MRTTLWVVPVLEVAAVSVLFVITHAIDRAAYRKTIELRDWVNNGSADAARQVLTGIAGTVITVVGLVFSITILALTVAATQFGPRMMRNFIRDTGTQVTLGTFVATFVYAILAPGSVSGGNVEFVPHLSVTVLLGMVLVDVGVLVYFIHRVAKSIQLTEVVACIARWLTSSIENEKADASAEHSDIAGSNERRCGGWPTRAWTCRPRKRVPAIHLVPDARPNRFEIGRCHRIAAAPGHFLAEGLPLARVWPAAAAPKVTAALDNAHVTGAHRTLTQDLAFAVD